MTQTLSKPNLLQIAGAGFSSASASAAGFCVAGLVYLGVEVEYQRFSDPSGRYEAVVMVPRGALLIPFAPGSGQDAAGSVHFYDADGNFYGSQRVERVGDVSVEWDDAGRAYVGVAGNLEEWELGEVEGAIA